MLHTLPTTEGLAGLSNRAVRRAIKKRLRERANQLGRNKVLCVARDLGRCQWPGCNATHNLTIHHLQPRSAGGGDGLRNLVTLCEAHHEAIHAPALASVSDYVGVQLCSTPK